ncbi:MAG: DUF87 domain-containing protein, partial [Patescibacteria group bacterium]
LRSRIAERERELLDRNPETDRADIETVGRQELKEYASFTPKMVLEEEHRLHDAEVTATAETTAHSSEPVEEVVSLAFEKGVRNALSVLEKIDNAYVTDEVHRRLVEEIHQGKVIQGLKEGVPPWQVLHMQLFEVTLPELSPNDRQYQLSELASMMEQFFLGMQTVGAIDGNNHYVFEIAVAEKSEDIVFYTAIPERYVDLFEKQLHALFPNATLIEQSKDYNVFVDKGTTVVSEVGLKKHPIYSLRSHDSFTADPLNVILNAFSKIEREGGGAAIQFVVQKPQHNHRKTYDDIIHRVEKGMKPKEAISRSTTSGELLATVGELFSAAPKKDELGELPQQQIDTTAIEVFKRKLQTQILETNIRIVASAADGHRAEQIVSEIESALQQFEAVDGNLLTFKRQTGTRLKRSVKAFSFREFDRSRMLPLALHELSTMIHFLGNGVHSSPQFRQAQSRTAPAPTEMPTAGTMLGVNAHRNDNRDIYISEADRMRHFYVIGQTGTGKSVFLKNLIMQDIQAGHGVCMIDPHGTDIEDVLGAIPEGREQDVIYFDPSEQSRVIGLNMLEYDYAKPEQKTFVVNELFSIFQKLYGANPESMGPMFEQYFRNATLLVMDDPESGNTLMDISRVMADARFRRQKLEKATNPVVTQFWREIATRAGGEAALENIVPYIVSKFDVFTANDYMRPIIGQQTSTFNFRQIMDEKKILLVNLSKGRLGEINANLIGMIVVGKLLMAALSRVDDTSQSLPPFFLHIDEFQNVSTNAIASILSEARKYKLSLTMAHQFIAQLDPAIKDAVFGNVGSMAAFRIGTEDAMALESQYQPVFAQADLMNIPNYNAYLRVLANGTPAKPFSVATNPPFASNPERAETLKQLSLHMHGRPLHEVEAEIQARYQKPTPPQPPAVSL